jgi:hypothetical protein
VNLPGFRFFRIVVFIVVFVVVLVVVVVEVVVEVVVQVVLEPGRLPLERLACGRCHVVGSAAGLGLGGAGGG